MGIKVTEGMNGSVLEIFTAPAAQTPVQSVSTAELIAGKGIVGDRYFSNEGTFSAKLETKGAADWEVTLIETEEIDRFNAALGADFSYGDFRRNIATCGIRLNPLVGQQFYVGDVLLEGIRLCEPCATLAATVAKSVLPDLIGRGGLRARILSGGQIAVGDNIYEPI